LTSSPEYINGIKFDKKGIVKNNPELAQAYNRIKA